MHYTVHTVHDAQMHYVLRTVHCWLITVHYALCINQVPQPLDLEAGQEHCTQVFFTSRWKVAQIRAGQKILDSIQRVPECQNDVNTYWLVSEWFLIHSNTTPTHFPTEISILSFTQRKFTKWAEENLCKIGAAQSAQVASKGATAHFGNRALGSKNQPIMAGQKCIKVIPANLDVLCKKLLSFFCSWQVFCPLA